MSSKSAKKNAKRREKEKDKKITSLVEERKRLEEEDESIQKADPVVALKQSLADAKTSGDHKLAAKLRQDLWVLQDASSGHNIQLESEDVEESMKRLEHVKQQQKEAVLAKEVQKVVTKKKITSSEAPSKEESTPTSTHPSSSIEKEIKKVKKKLEQIDKLKKSKEAGETLQACQIEKLEKEESFKGQLSELEESFRTSNVVR